MDTQADTCCAGANWTPMQYTGEICEVSLFLNTYAPVQYIPVARCCIVNPSQIRAYGLLINDNPFNANDLGIGAEELFIPFDTTGTVVHFESHLPKEWETTHLPIILITEDSWDHTTVDTSASK